MQCFLLEGEYTRSAWQWGADAFHRWSRVNRLQRQEVLDLILPSGERWTVKILDISQRELRYEVLAILPSDQAAEGAQVTLFQCLPKGDKMDLILNQCTQAGIHAIVPLNSSRTIVKWDLKKSQKHYERWQEIVLQASEQSHRNTVPEVSLPSDLLRLKAEDLHDFDLKLTAWELCYDRSLRAALSSVTTPFPRIALVIGPEGGLSAEECAFLSGLGFVSFSLGGSILRTESAGFYALSQINFQFNPA